MSKNPVGKPASTELPLTIKIPGGTATFCKKSELSPRREREMDVLYAQMSSKKIRAIQRAQTVIVEGQESGKDVSDVLDGEDTTLTEEEARLFFRASEVGAWAYLKSWTLKVSHQEGSATVSEPRPLPATPDDYLDLPTSLYKAITDHAAKIVAQDIDDGFDVGSAGNPESPTTA